ncbi:hypothetical protein [Pyxidicoccus sp. MSG2]|uniref:hypothetical protein n=1 Tax=Pyxidicoccus sp. MSG2 TaxID=2996790 RepID=UPI00226F921E|nr:hypothetical protein [Pyxidicoccus sp. MSG2]MCY1014350.1 hypothetical protein [Pyxidicoccus sp. MSG2]
MTSFILARTARRTWCRCSRTLGALGTLWLGLGAVTSHAAAFQVEARTEAQAYQIRAWRGTTPEDPVLLPRRRIVQYLGLNAFELVTGQDMGFESNLRVWADFGLPRGEAALVDGLKSEDAELLHAYVRYAKGGFEGRLGRQLYADVTDILAFDGLRLRYVSRLGLGVEAIGGLWVKGASVLGSSVYQLDGTRTPSGTTSRGPRGTRRGCAWTSCPWARCATTCRALAACTTTTSTRSWVSHRRWTGRALRRRAAWVERSVRRCGRATSARRWT